MNKQVTVNLKTTIRQPNEEPEMYELCATGTLIEKGQFVYLKYAEVQEEKEINTTVKMSDTEALIMRTGAVNMRLPFLKEAEQTGRYDSEYGMLNVTTSTTRMLLEQKQNDGHFMVQYDLNVSGQPVGEYTLEFYFTEGSQ